MIDTLDNDLVVSDTQNDNDQFDKLLSPGIYDWAKESRSYLNTIGLLLLSKLQLYELIKFLSIGHDNYIQIARFRYHDVNIKLAKLNIKFNHIIKKTDLFWP